MVVAVFIEPFGDAAAAAAALVVVGDEAAGALATGLLLVAIAGAGDVDAGEVAAFSGDSVVFCAAAGVPDVSIFLGGSGLAGGTGGACIVDGSAVSGPVSAGVSALVAVASGADPFAWLSAISDMAGRFGSRRT